MWKQCGTWGRIWLLAHLSVHAGHIHVSGDQDTGGPRPDITQKDSQGLGSPQTGPNNLNPEIMEYRWHNPRMATEQAKLLGELAEALGLAEALWTTSAITSSGRSRSPSPSPSRVWGVSKPGSTLHNYQRQVFGIMEVYAHDKR